MKNKAEILIPIIGAIVILSWVFLIVPDLKNDISTFEIHTERKGERSFAENVGDSLSAPEPIRETLSFQVTGSNGNILEITSFYRSVDVFTEEIMWEGVDIYHVDKTTRKHVEDKDGYFLFPYNVQKQNYVLTHPFVGDPTTFFYEKTEYIDDLEVYVFSCNSLDGDRTSTYPQHSPATIHSDHTCLIKVEPITGKIVYFHTTWDNHVTQDGLRSSIAVGHGETTVFTQDTRVKTVKDEKQLFQFYDSIVPTFMILTLAAVFTTSVYNKKSKAQGKVIKKQFEELKQADKTKTLFLNNLTHELKTPLVPIQGNSEMLKNPKMGELNEMQRESVNEIYDYSTSLLSTVENFLKLQKITEGKAELKIQEIKIDELTEIISKIPTKDNKINIKISFGKELSVNADKARLIDVFTELIKNTSDFLPEQDGTIEINAKDQNGNVLFSIKDNGTGIPKDKQKEIFKPFIKADMSQSRKHGGVGLGLAICKGYVEGMKGKIWVESEENKGSTFFFTIPKSD